MLLSFDTIQLLSNFIIVFLSILVIEPPVGYLRAWVAKKMGDNTGESLGYLTLNPFVHIDPMGLLAFCLLGFGWFNRVPVNPNNITGRYKHAKLALAMFSSFIAYILMAVIATILFIFVAHMGTPTTGALSASSWTNIFIVLLSTIMSLCIALAVLDVVMNVTLLVALAVYHRSSYHIAHVEFFALIAAFLILIFCGSALRRLMIYAVEHILYFLGHIFSWFV